MTSCRITCTLAVLLASWTGAGARHSVHAAESLQDIVLGDGSGWHFVGGHGPWTESEGVIRPHDERMVID